MNTLKSGSSISSPLRRVAMAILPAAVVNRLRARTQNRKEAALAGETLQETFSGIYSTGRWGRSDHGFYSGFGSHDPSMVEPYVSAVRSFIDELGGTLSAVDLGCGDFNIGRQICHQFGSYTACDLVPELIAENRRRFADLAVDFRVVNIAVDPLPPGDVVFIRQVLQHLSNAAISAAVAKLTSYRYAIITEHLPAVSSFRPNVDKPSGPSIRLAFGSGVVLTKPPFGLKPLSERTLCEAPIADGVVRTIAYKLR